MIAAESSRQGATAAESGLVAKAALTAQDAREPAHFIEAAADDHETVMAYDEASRVPWWVVFVWVLTITGFIAYLVRYLFPDLAVWGSP